MLLFILLCCLGHQIDGLTAPRTAVSQSMSRRNSVLVPPLKMMDSTVVSVAGGAVAGAVGLGVAYPFDSLKTKAQTLTASGADSLPMIPLMKKVLRDEGMRGFYSGVSGSMSGQAFIKSIAFASNTVVLNNLHVTQDEATLTQLVISAAIAGAMCSIVTNPVERVKILMQADVEGKYSSELVVAVNILREDGLLGFVCRGMEATLLREVPGYSFYFVAYNLLLRSSLGVMLGPFFGSLVSGGLAGMASWLPVYPIDVCKTFIQNCGGGGQGDLSEEATDGCILFKDPEIPSTLEVAIYLNDRYGPGVFYEGLNPKLIRAAVNHSVTFAVFQLIVDNVK